MMIDTPTMRNRFAAQSAIEELLLVQGSTVPRTRLACFFGRSPLGVDSAAWYACAKGERVVGSVLATLPKEWKVFHSLPVGTGIDIDHLAIGPAGVFTISTKHHHGKSVRVSGRTVMVARQKKEYIRDAEIEATRVSELMRERMPKSTSARPVVAIVHPARLAIRRRPAQVKVIDARNLRAWLLALPPVLAWPERMEVNAVIDSPASWLAEPAAPTTNLLAGFAALDADVRVARIRRLFWRVLGIVTATGVGIAVGPLLAADTMILLTGGR